MKKNVIFMMLIAAPIMASAQLKIQSNGYAAFQYTGTAISPISINNTGESTYYMAYRGNKNGIYSVTYGGCDPYNWGYGLSVYNAPNTSTASFYIGMKGMAYPNNNQTWSSGRGYGVFGQAGNFKSGFNYGVFGRISGSQYGAGIYGTTNTSDNGAQLDGIYAGYFNGNTRVVGNLTVTGNINGTLLQDAAPSNLNTTTVIGSQDRGEQTVGARLAALNAVSYYHPATTRQRTSSAEQGDTLVEEQPMGVIETQVMAKQHYALDVEQLENSFPELVYVKEDGTKAINYMEMIPLLVATINELQSEVATLQNLASGSARTRGYGTSTGIDATGVKVASLAQNTPNPFNEQTAIRFTLPDDTQHAYICIFDMTGKTLKKLPVSLGMESVSVSGYELGEGIFLYSLVVNGQEIDTKRMIITK